MDGGIDVFFGMRIRECLHLLTGVAFLALALQVWLLHSRQNFRSWPMWIPVIAAPVLGVLELLNAFGGGDGLNAFSRVVFWVSAVVGLIGTWIHIRGVGERIGGYKGMNFLVGPPLVLPAFITVLSLYALLILALGGR